MHRPETNPHFIRLQSQDGHLPGQPSPLAQQPLHPRDAHGRAASPPPRLHPHDPHGQPASPPPRRRGRRASYTPPPLMRIKPKGEIDPEPPVVIAPPMQHPPRNGSPETRHPLHGTQVIDDPHRPHLTPQYTKPVPLSPDPVSSPPTGIQNGRRDRHGTPLITPPVKSRPPTGIQNGHRDRHGTPLMPPPEKTNPLTWSAAVCCAIFWLIVILGGLIVLIVYLLYRPRSPQVSVTGAVLNTAYLDMGFLLNADVSFLANFTNPSKKGVVRFSYVTFDLYHGSTLLASQYVPPFSIVRAQSVLAYVHFISSQVGLRQEDVQRLRKQIVSNRITFEVKGVFHAKTHLGHFMRYPYHLYTHCTIMVTGPPTGILIANRCRTKR